ncbi:MAG: DNA-directed RNA polymerase subunit beta [Streptococcaceae bacterium]|nr:DNA-directed RNA polymerase subunit beta [Streptococcaceae bacterium]
MRKILFKTLRLIVILLIAAVVFYAGIVVGFAVIGNGKASEVLKPAIWQNFFSLFK